MEVIFHSLRLTHSIELLFKHKVSPKSIRERRGPPTLQLYAHVIPGMQKDAADKVDEGVDVINWQE
jgi:hypothetical protein